MKVPGFVVATVGVSAKVTPSKPFRLAAAIAVSKSHQSRGSLLDACRFGLDGFPNGFPIVRLVLSRTAAEMSLYDIPFKALAETIITIAADPKRLRAQPRT